MIIERRQYTIDTCELRKISYYDDSKQGMQAYNNWILRAVQYGAKFEQVTGYETIDVRFTDKEAVFFYRIDVLTEEEAKTSYKECKENDIRVALTDPTMFE